MKMADGLSIYNSQLDAFELYHQIQEDPSKPPPSPSSSALPALSNALAGAIGASISNICTYPLAIVITRLQTQQRTRKPTQLSPHDSQYTSIRDALLKISAQEGGLSGFYTGVVPDTAKTIADAFLFFLAYTLLRRSRLQHLHPTKPANHLPVLDELTVGVLAGAFTKFLTTPIANIVTRLQTCPHESIKQQPTARTIAAQILRENGLRGFWSGYSASLILTLNPSLTFFFFETLKRFLPRSQRSHPSARAVFLLAALSKAGASGITYPFSLAKARLQTSSRTSSAEGEEDEDGKNDAKHQHLRRKPPSTNVFTTLLALARAEGVSAWYEGLSGEVVKGFLSHGITMLVKERVHGGVVWLWYLLLRMLKREVRRGKMV